MDSRLTPLQRNVLTLLVGLEPVWTLTGGAALVGFHLGHRTTRDLDLFFHDISTLADVPDDVILRLREAGLTVTTQRSASTFRRLEVRDAREVILVDLVAEQVPWIEAPVEMEPGLRVDTAQEILVNKLCALLGRSAIRDLVDAMALVEAGADLDQALRMAPLKDGGFSPPTLAWLLNELPIERLAADSGFESEPLKAFRERMLEKLLR